MATEQEIEAVAEALGSYGMIDTYWHCLPEFERGKYRNRARAAISALDAIRAQDRWRPMDDAPRDGQTFIAVVRGQVRLVSFCAASCFPVVGFCLADQGVDGYARCEPTHWRPLPAPPKGGELSARVIEAPK